MTVETIRPQGASPGALFKVWNLGTKKWPVSPCRCFQRCNLVVFVIDDRLRLIGGDAITEESFLAAVDVGLRPPQDTESGRVWASSALF